MLILYSFIKWWCNI